MGRETPWYHPNCGFSDKTAAFLPVTKAYAFTLRKGALQNGTRRAGIAAFFRRPFSRFSPSRLSVGTLRASFQRYTVEIIPPASGLVKAFFPDTPPELWASAIPD